MIRILNKVIYLSPYILGYIGKCINIIINKNILKNNFQYHKGNDKIMDSPLININKEKYNPYNDGI